MRNVAVNTSRRLSLPVACLGIVLVLPGFVRAATNYYVAPAGPGGAGTNWATAFSNVQDAASRAVGAGDAIYLQAGAYSNASQVVVSNAGGVTLYGGCVGNGTNTYSGTNSTLTRTGGVMRIVYAENSTVTVAGVTVSGGLFTNGLNFGAGMFFTNCVATLTNCAVLNNTNINTTVAFSGGGGIYAAGGSLAIRNCVFSNNYLYGPGPSGSPSPANNLPGGGALAGNNLTLTISGSIFASNRVSNGTWFNGGGLHLVSSTLSISNCQFYNNSAIGGNDGYGGAICASYGTVEIVESGFGTNYTGRASGNGYGGAIYLNSVASASVVSNYFCDNYNRGPTLGGGAAIYLIGCTNTTINQCTMEGAGRIPHADYIYVSGGGLLNIFNTTMQSNCLYGGLYFAGGAASRLVMTNCQISGNYAYGMYMAGGTGILDRCVLRNNNENGIYVQGASTILSLTNCLLSQNGFDGLRVSYGRVNVAHCTLAHNGGWGLNHLSGTGVVVNSIAWGNIGGGIASNSSLYVDYSCLQAAAFGGASNVYSDPLFANVRDSYYLSVSGLTGQTVSSPCIAAGSNSASAWGLTNLTTRTDGAGDTNAPVDIGYHYASGNSDVKTATNCYVDAVSGNNTNAGTTWATAWKSLTYALSNVTANATINVATGTYNVASGEAFPLVVQMPGLTMMASNVNPSWTVVDNAYASGRRVLQADSKGVLALHGLTFRGGYYSTGSNNYGAGLYLKGCATLLTNCVVRDNTNMNTSASTPFFGYGGGMYAQGGTLAIVGCVFSNNHLNSLGPPSPVYIPSGGALAANNLTLRVADSVFADNHVNGGTYSQGGTLSFDSGSVCVSNCQFYNSYSIGNNDHNGGAVYISQAPVAEIVNAAFCSNYAGRGGGYGYGGALHLSSVTDSLIASNYFCDNYIRGPSSANGAAIYVTGCTTTSVDRCIIESRNRTANAEHVYVNGGFNKVLNTVVQNNLSHRGAYFTGASGQFALTNCLVVKNAGHGLELASGTAIVVNCTFAHNVGWGFARPTSAALTVKNSIFWGNAMGGIGHNYNLTMDHTDAQDFWAPAAGPGNFSADPLFVNPAAGDYHLQSTAGSWREGGAWVNDARLSPCIDAGDPASDFSLESKPSGGRVNLGRFGNTAEASRSSRGTVVWVW